MAQIARLHVDHDLGAGQTLPLGRDAAHYLFNVLRLGPGAPVEVFNGRDGCWRATVAEAGKRGGALACEALAFVQDAPQDLWLLFAPVKKAQTDFIVEKAVEMGVARLCPVATDFTNSERIRPEKIEARIVEAAEQCGIAYLPALAPMRKLSATLDGWDPARRLLFCDEAARGTGLSPLDPPGAWAVLIGPEGGFSDTERARLRGLPFATATGLGPRILRAETAVVAALALWQSTLGDWRADVRP